MEQAARMPGMSVSDSEDFRVGEHVHQLLNLAGALVAAASKTASVQVGPGVSSGAPDASFGGVPFGLDLGALTDTECVRWAQDLERLGTFQQALGVGAAAELAQRAGAGRYASTGVSGAADLLVQSLKISAGEAHRRISLAEAVLPTMDSVTGVLAPPTQPLLGEAFCKGEIAQEQALMIAKFADEACRLAANGRISAERCDEVRETLVQSGRDGGPDFLRQVGNRVMSLLDPDGQKPSHADLVAKQCLFFRKPRHGLIHFDGHMTIAQHEQLMAAIGTGTNPNKHADINTINTDTPPPPNSQGGQGGGSGVAGANAGPDGTGSGTGSEADSRDDGAGSGQGELFDRLNSLIGVFNPSPGPVDAPQDLGKDPESDRPGQPPQPPPPQPPQPDQPRLADQPGRPAQPGRPGRSGVAGTGQPRPAPPALFQQRSPFDVSTDARVEVGGVPGGPRHNEANGWGRRLEDWEIPPRPVEAPANAVAPKYEGEQWFWFTAEPAPSGPSMWKPKITGGDDFKIWEQPRPPVAADNSGFNIWEQQPPPVAQAGMPDSSTPPPESPEPGGTGPGRGDVGREPLFEDSGPLGDGGNENAGESRVIDGVRIPFPGTGEVLAGLDPIDPESTDPVSKDERTYGQKLLDGLLDCVKLAARTDKLPLNGGLKTQLIITCSQEDLERNDGTGTAFTTYNGPVPLALFDQALCDPEIIRLGMGQGQEILSVGRAQRLFTPAQRKLLLARDLGCCFTDCRAPATWCEAHHILPWQEGGETSIENGALLCSRHHGLIHHSDWTMKLITGTPYFTAPYLVDPSQTPRRNTYHHGLPKPTNTNTPNQYWN